MTAWTRPEDIVAALQRRWLRGELLADRVLGRQLFPLDLPLRRPAARDVTGQFGAVQDWVAQLRAGSAEGRGRGYRLVWERMVNRVQGANDMPVAARIETAEDAWFLLRVQGAVRSFDAIVESVRARRPVLVDWLAERALLALEHADDWPALLAILDFFLARPRPGLYLRQLDIPGVDTKFIESRRRLVGELLDRVLPADAVNGAASGAARFAARYGLRSEPDLVRFRVLDPTLGFGGFSDLSVPVQEFARGVPPVARVFITENRINGLAMPDCAGSIVIFGLGYGLDRLAAIPWLARCETWYWGDIDTHGFGMLHRLRHALPNVRSLLMDRDTLLAHRALWVTEPAEHRYAGDPERLTADERALFDDLRHDRLGERVRLEQERIAFGLVERAVARLVRVSPQTG